MDYFPIFLKIEDRPCLVVGAGKVAARKIALLARAGAHTTVVSPEVCAEVKELIKQDNVSCIERQFREEDMDGVVLVIAATDDEAINRGVSALAHQHRIPVNVVNAPNEGNFIMPSIIIAPRYRLRFPPVVPRRYSRGCCVPVWRVLSPRLMGGWHTW